MSEALTLYTHPLSRARITRWMLEECGATYDSVALEYGGSMKAPDYLAINPMGKVPALVHGRTVVTESAAIAAYLADLFPAQQLAPPLGSAARGSYYRWLFFVAGPVEAAFSAQSQGFLAQQTPEQALSAGYGRFEDVLRTLHQAVAGKRYLCGDQFTAADLLMAGYLRWGTLTGVLPPQAAFSDYFEPLVARAANVRAQQMDDALLAAAG